MWTAPPATEPDGQAGRPLGRVLAVAASALAIVLLAGVAPAAAQDAPPKPRVPQPALLLGECDATLSVLDLVPGRAYDIAVTDSAGAAVFSAAGLVAASESLDSFVTVPAGVHSWTVADTHSPEFAASRTIDVAPCAAETPAPPAEPAPSASDPASDPASDEPVTAGPALVQDSPAIAVELLACDLLGASDIRVSFAGISSGTYLAGVAENGAPVTGVADATIRPTTRSILFADLPNGGTYLVWLKNDRGTTVATTSVALPICDLPTLDVPVAGGGSGSDQDASTGQRTLAATGLPTESVMAGAAVALLAGAIALLLSRRRRA